MRRGSLTSPATLLTSHQPPSEKKAAIDAADQGPGERLGAGPLRDQGRQVRPVSAAQAEPPEDEEAEQPELERRQHAEYFRAERHAPHVHGRQQPGRGDRHRLQAPGREGHEVADVARQADRHRRGDARVGDQERQPAEEERDPRAVRLLQVDVRPAGLREPRREGPEADRAPRRPPADEHPDHQQPERRAHRFGHARRRQEDPDPDHLGHHQGRRRQEAQLPRQRGVASVRVCHARIVMHQHHPERIDVT